MKTMYKFIGGPSCFPQTHFTKGKAYEMVEGTLCEYQHVPDDARFVADDGEKRWQDLRCFELVEPESRVGKRYVFKGHKHGLRQGHFIVGNTYVLSVDDGTDEPKFLDEYGNSCWKCLSDFKPEPEYQYDASSMNASLEWIESLSDKIGGAFIWSGTPEGHRYWSEVSSKLNQMVRDIRKQKGVK